MINKKNKNESRFVDVFDNMHEAEIDRIKTLSKKESISAPKGNSTKTSMKNYIEHKPGDYQINEKTRGEKIDKKCTVCDGEIENIFELFYDSMFLGNSTPAWSKTKTRCSNCRILYDI